MDARRHRQEGEKFWGQGFRWLVNRGLEIRGSYFLFFSPAVGNASNSYKYTGLYFSLGLGLYKGIERSPLEEAKPNPHPAVPSCEFSSCCRHQNLPCHLIGMLPPWHECFSTRAEARFERNVLHSLCLQIWGMGVRGGGGRKTKPQEHLSQLQ